MESQCDVCDKFGFLFYFSLMYKKIFVEENIFKNLDEYLTWSIHNSNVLQIPTGVKKETPSKSIQCQLKRILNILIFISFIQK